MAMCQIGERRRTIYIEPIEEPATTPFEEPSPEIDPIPSLDPPEHQPEPSR
jgi:hypothetical protein